MPMFWKPTFWIMEETGPSSANVIDILESEEEAILLAKTHDTTNRVTVREMQPYGHVVFSTDDSEE